MNKKCQRRKRDVVKIKMYFFPVKTIRKDDQPLIVSRVDLFLFDLLFPNHNIPPKNVLRKKKCHSLEPGHLNFFLNKIGIEFAVLSLF